MKKIGILLFIIFLFLGGTWMVLITVFPNEKPVEFISGGDGWKIKFGKREEKFLKNVVRKIENIVYQEATEHNPEGDFLPDQIDDTIKKEIKSRLD